ncbi:MAG: ribbon-helix-helix protein, CopG family [Ardenticatenaceae bacterium]|nr:ribbon-helix-helix protein, CopG family [Ardenticatenaceae bacterium]
MVRTTIMAEEDILYKIERIAREQGKSKAEVIREALVMYVTDVETQNPPINPLLSLIGLAGDEGEEMDLSDGKDEEILREEWNKQYEERYG